MTYPQFRERLCAELRIWKGHKLTPWMQEVGYTPDDKDMGLRAWCRLTGTDLNTYLAEQKKADEPPQLTLPLCQE